MADTGALSAGTGATSGLPAWASPARIVASDNSRTTNNSLASLATTGTLISSQHGAAVPSDATIDGILVEIERSGDSGATDGIEDSSARLATGGAAVGDNKASTATWPDAASETYAAYGGAADTWGRTWTPAEVNSTDFGIQLVAVNTDAVARDPRVDHIRITIYYTEAGGGGGVSPGAAPRLIRRGFGVNGGGIHAIITRGYGVLNPSSNAPQPRGIHLRGSLPSFHLRGSGTEYRKVGSLPSFNLRGSASTE